MNEPQPLAPEEDTRTQKIIRWAFWIGFAVLTIGVFASLFFNR